MNKLALIVIAFILIAGAIVTLFPNWNWQGALLILAVGLGFLVYAIKG